MADVKISGLPASTTPLAGTEVLPIVQGGQTRQVSVTNLTAGRSVSATSFVPSSATIPTNGLYLPAANSVGLATNSAERMRIDSAGSVGIGNSSPNSYDSRLVVESNGKNTGLVVGDLVTPANPTSIYLRTNGEASFFNAVGGSFAWGENGGAVRMRISSSGIVTMPAYGAGTATFSASGVISSVSDETWKIKDGIPVNPDAMIQKLEPGYWFYNKEKEPIFGGERQLGFYAQNVHEAIGSEAAPMPEEGKPWGYYDRSVLAVTVMSLKNALKTIQELNDKFDAYVASHP